MSYAPGPSFLGLKYIDETTTDTVSSGTHDIITIQPPKGFVYQLAYIIWQSPDPAGSSSGNQQLILDYTDGTTDLSYVNIVGNTGTSYAYMSRYFASGDSVTPSVSTYLVECFKNMIINNELYAKFDYYNNTDVDQSGTRQLYTYWKVFKELL